jgi:nucleoside-diphosphate-sugar epimerase
MTYVLLGGGGILGTGFREALGREDEVVRVRPLWGRPTDVSAEVRDVLADLPGPVTVIWAAGVGQIGAHEDVMRSETATVEALCTILGGREEDVSFLFASSAGALFGGHGTSVIEPGDTPSPITSYGHEKLQQEAAVQRLAERGCRVIICRYSNLYGLADGWLTARGLVSTALRATRLRQPMIVYVSADTRRDLVYNVDAARESLALLADADVGVTTALVAAGETRTVAEILGLVGRVSGRRVPATYAERPETRVQPRALRFRLDEGNPAIRHTPMETALHLMLRAPMAA